jgi:hypothetical protein
MRPRFDRDGRVMYYLGGQYDVTGQVRAVLVDQSQVWGRLAAFDGKSMRLERSDGVAFELAWADVHHLSVRSDRMVFLSDLEALAESSRGLATLPTWPIERDRSVMGNKLTLGDGQVYHKGLGMHAAASIAYPVGRYDVFAATIGIDRETDGRGDCVFVVKVDGTEKLRRRMTGADKPHDIRVPITGARRLELIVEPGENLDIADHADWADARLIRQAD